ncbi:hypothetical protein SAMD00019534_115400 [Acytostelium subglobosum LB1]|uniref:hypothetical protein n=1 Tax=Acytostelium subglobosum LB1 TaxID=1410327 RepID=UPI000644EFDA|nr:hypothetical protein SAMD00019534_115400 [Acytostelium subglobosum LB1]GAM28364.1 hypothetical protein SAMD00019534_115400 [Acytostelium subglobosum LB1]|eukprot:XP_012748681.1 hypothetical protein SAMD00019534_115400 [Acytostelium subglobosum LB1]
MMESLDIRILETKCILLKQNQQQNIKLKIGTGKLGGWIKQCSSSLPLDHIALNNGHVDINWDWSLSLKYKPKNQYIYIRLMEDGFLSNIIGESVIEIGSLSMNNNNNSQTLCVPLHLMSPGYDQSKTAPIRVGELILTVGSCSSGMGSSRNIGAPAKAIADGIPAKSDDADDKSGVPIHENGSDHMAIDSDQMVPEQEVVTTHSSTFKEQLKESISSASQMIIDAIRGRSSSFGNSSDHPEAKNLVKEMKSFLRREEKAIRSQPSLSDTVQLVVIQCSGLEKEFAANTLMMGCRVKIGTSMENKKDTILKPSSQLLWKQFFDISLAHPLQRFSVSMQLLTIQLLDHSTTPPTVFGESKELNLYSLEREKITELWMPIKITNSQYEDMSCSPKVHLVLKYTTGRMNNDEMTELLYQSLCGQDRVLISSLLQQGAKINSYFIENRNADHPSYTTPLIKAAKNGNLHLVKSLVELGANVNFADPEGFTPLMKAFQFEGIHQPSCIHVARVLLDAGANPSFRNKKGDDIFKYCRTRATFQFATSFISSNFHEVAVVKCPRCYSIDVPMCTEYRNSPIFQTSTCRCPRPSNCQSCNFPLTFKDEYTRIIAKKEVKYLIRNYHSILKNYPQLLVCCPCCQSMAFLGVTAELSLGGTFVEENDIMNHIQHLPNCNSIRLHYSKVMLTSKSLDALLHLAQRSPLSNFNAIMAPPAKDKDYAPFNMLPHELIISICSKMDSWTDIIHLTQLNWQFNRVLSDSMFWKNKLFSLFSISRSSLLPSPQRLFNTSFKSLYGHYTSLAEWIRLLLLEETFKPRYAYEINSSNGNLRVELSLTSKKYLFNKEGHSFNFVNEFKLILEFSAIKQLEHIEILANNQPIELIADLSSQMTLPTNENQPTSEEINKHVGKASIHLKLQAKAIDRWINQYLKFMFPGFHNFLLIRDDVGGSIILDFFYYDIHSITLHH